MFLFLLVLGVTLNAPILLANDGEHSGNSKITGSATDEKSDKDNSVSGSDDDNDDNSG